MHVKYGNRNGTLDEFFIADTGYEAPKTDLVGSVKEGIEVVLFVPEHSEQISTKVQRLETLLNEAVREKTKASLVMPYGTPTFTTELFTCKEDKDNECAIEYGVLSDEGITAMSLFVLARDNNIYHRQLLSSEDEEFKEKSFLAGVSQAINCFTGVGCHG